MTWPEPIAFVWGVFAVTAAGAALPIRTERREDYPILAIATAVAASLFGPLCLVLVWGAVVVAVPARVAWARLPRNRKRADLPSAAWSLGWLVVTAAACSVGFVVGGGVYVGVFGRSYPATLDSTGAVLAALVSVTTAWLGTMTVVVLAARRVTGPLIPRGLDPFDSLSVPYVLPLMGGFPLVVASVAMYQPSSPWPSLLILLWCFPLYGATALDRHRRVLAQDLRRDALAKQRLAAIGEVSARLVHQSRHQVGLMGWSIHRLRGLLGTGDGRPVDLDAVGRELDELTAAKDRLSRMLASDVLHEGDGEGRGEGGRGIAATETDRRASLAEVVAEVCDQLATEAEREGVRLSMQVDDPAAAAGPASAALVDVVFNLVDNAIDAASSQVVVALGTADGAAEATTVVRVLDDGAGLSPADAVHAFEPFFTTKPDGTGMGLAIADALVGELGGDLRHDRVDDRTVFTVSVPRPREVVEEPDRVAKRPA